MTELDGVLGELAKLKTGSEPIVSLYLDVRWHDEQQRERVRLCVREKARAILGHYAAGAPGSRARIRGCERIPVDSSVGPTWARFVVPRGCPSYRPIRSSEPVGVRPGRGARHDPRGPLAQQEPGGSRTDAA